MTIEGVINQILPLQKGVSKTGKEWKKLSFIISTNEQYPRTICMELFGDKVDNNPIKVNEVVSVSFDIESREYNGRWFTQVSAYKVERIANAVENQPMSAMDQAAQAYFDNAPKQQPINVPADGGHVEEGELPF